MLRDVSGNWRARTDSNLRSSVFSSSRSDPASGERSGIQIANGARPFLWVFLWEEKSPTEKCLILWWRTQS